MATYFATMAALKAANKKAGQHWFEEGAIRFFRTKFVSGIICNHFITSEQFDDDAPVLYSLHKANAAGVVEMVGTFQQYETLNAAQFALAQAAANTGGEI